MCDIREMCDTVREHLACPDACICQPPLTERGLRSWSDTEFPSQQPKQMP